MGYKQRLASHFSTYFRADTTLPFSATFVYSVIHLLRESQAPHAGAGAADDGNELEDGGADAPEEQGGDNAGEGSSAARSKLEGGIRRNGRQLFVLRVGFEITFLLIEVDLIYRQMRRLMSLRSKFCME